MIKHPITEEEKETLDIKFVLEFKAYEAWINLKKEKKLSKGKGKMAVYDSNMEISSQPQSSTKNSVYDHAKKTLPDIQDIYSASCSRYVEHNQQDKSFSQCIKEFGQQIIINDDMEEDDIEQQEDAPLEEVRRLPKKRKRCSGENSSNEEVNNVVPPIDPIPLEFKRCIEEMGGSNEMLVLRKKITETDAKKSHDRLLIPVKSMRVQFLNEDEMNLLEEPVARGCASIRASIIQPSREKCEISLRRWNMEKKNKKVYKCFVLNSGWYALLHRNGIEKDHIIQLWAFRDRDSKLCFALIDLGKELANH